MCSTQFEFLDLSNIKEEDYQELVEILEEKAEICLPAGEGSPGKDIKEEVEEEEEEENEKKPLVEEDDFISQSSRDESASGISFFFDGGTADDIDPTKTPPILSSSETPPQSESPSTLCNDTDEIPAEEPMELYPPSHTPQTPYINQPPPMVPPMNVHGIPTSGPPLYNMPPPFTPHSTPTGIHNGMYSIPPSHAPSQLLPQTVHIENCHVNFPPYGGTQPPGGIYPTQPPHPQYQGSPHPQVFQQFLITDQPPMSMSVKPTPDKEHDYKRHDIHGRGSYRGRGRGRGGRRGRDDHERSNSVSSDHSSYSDSGSKAHYKDNGPPPPVPPSHYSLVSYPHYVPYHVNHPLRPHQGFPLMSPQFIPNTYSPDPSHVLAYSAQPPASVALVTNENTNQLPRHSECVPIMMAPTSVPQVSSISSHSTYIVTSGYETASNFEANQYSYCSVDENNVHINLHSTTPTSTIDQPIYSQNSSQNSNCNTKVQAKDDSEEQIPTVVDHEVDTLEENIPNLKIEQKERSLVSTNIQSSEGETVEFESKECVNNVMPSISVESQSSSQLSNSSLNLVSNQNSEKSIKIANNEKNLKQNKSQPKPQNYPPKPMNIIDPPTENSNIENDTNSSVSLKKNSPVPSNNIKRKENGTSSKSKNRKNSPQNKDNNSVSLSPIIHPSRDKENIINHVPNVPANDKNKSQSPVQQQPKLVKTLSGSEEKKKGETKKNQSSVSSLPIEIARDSSSPEFEFESKANIDETELPLANNSFENSTTKVTTEPQNNVHSPTKPFEAWGQKMSWSQLFKPNEEFPAKQIAFVSPFNAKEVSETNGSKEPPSEENGSINFSDSEAEKAKVGNSLKKYVPDYRPVLLQPRGLINKNYWCYVNAPLQALLACPSFYQLAKSLSQEAGYKTGNVSTPFINSIVDFVSEFTPMSNSLKQNRKEKNTNKKEPEVLPGSPFEPTCVYKMLCNYKKDQFAEGRQQDAEEMLSCVLNGLHDEMVESLKLAGGTENTPNGVPVADRNGSDHISEDESEWKVQGPKKKSYVTRTAHFNPSPISQIFWGQFRSVLQPAGGNMTANLQPFNTLPLDIQSPKVDTLKDALSQLVVREEITGFTCPKTNQEVTASNQVMFEDLPRVLILQLKRFIYDNGGLQKVTKRLQFSIDLDITKDLISTNSRGKFSNSQRRYKLFAIVNHEGKEATKGHYVADVFHNGYNCWIRYDDSSVKAIPESVVLRHEPPRVPYLLFYRRSDTLASPANGNGNNSSSNGKSSK